MKKTESLLEVVMAVTKFVASKVREVVWSKSHYEHHQSQRYIGDDDYHVDPVLDEIADTTTRDVLGSLVKDNFVLITEEETGHLVQKGCDSGDICFISDPLDGSAFARHRIPIASSSLCAYSRKESRAVASAVTDIFLDITYYTAEHLEGAYLEKGGVTYKIRPSECRRLEEASSTSLGAQPQRFSFLRSQPDFTSSVRWLLNTGGALDICHVAAGDLDLSVEFAKGFRIWDIAAAGHILEKAGGYFRTPERKRIKLLKKLDQRYRFIASATEALFIQVQRKINWHNLS